MNAAVAASVMVVVAAWAVAGCSKEPAAGAGASAVAPASAASGGGGSGGGPVSVTSVRALRRDVEVMLEATGTVAALNSVDIRSQVNSVITEVNIREGQFVKAGQLLFTLDARTDEANLARARAQLAKDEASLADAQRQLSRSKDLVAQNFISQSALDTNQTLVDTTQSAVVASRAAIGSVQIALSYDRIVAPAAGRAGAINVFAGTTVQSGGVALVTITQLDPIGVAFSLPQRNLNDALRTLRAGGGKVTAVLPDKRGSAVGRLLFVDNAIDANSGTLRVKARFDNREETLWPGAFVTVRLAVNTLKDATVLPQVAVIQGPRGSIVYVIDAQNKAQARPVEVVYAAGLDAVVSGVQPGERVVLDGRQNLRAGVTVAERVASAASGAGAGASGAGPGRAMDAASDARARRAASDGSAAAAP
ncbi:MAG: efflux RND transporter periplasmic adaptor subunit [Bacteriovorax sp.]|nr:efflux RND transporter periplasmic adaptor subunit [Rhizobacter sp.]